MSYRGRVALKAAVWIASLWPLGVLVRGFLMDDLGANPIDYITRTLGLTALVLLLTSLGMTPLRILFGWSWPIQLRRLLGLLAFFYICLHFAVWIGLDHFFAWRRMWEDVVKRPFITVGFVGFMSMVPLAAPALWLPSALAQIQRTAATTTRTQGEKNSVELKQGMTLEEVQQLLGKPPVIQFGSHGIECF